MTAKLEVLNHITDDEVEILKTQKYVKYVYHREAGDHADMYMWAGEDTTVDEVLESVFSVLTTVYDGLKRDPEEVETAEWLKNKIIEKVNGDEFWEDDGSEMKVLSNSESLVGKKGMA